MNLRSTALVALFVAIAATGCSSTPKNSIDVVNRKQADSLDALGDKGLARLAEAGYTALAVGTTDDGDSVLLLRNCGKKPGSLDNCLDNIRPGIEAPDVYLGVKDPSVDQLTLTGTYDLLYAPAVGHHPDNGLKCQSDPVDTKFTPETVDSFKALGRQARKLNYKSFEGGSPTQTLQIEEGWWKCQPTFGYTL